MNPYIFKSNQFRTKRDFMVRASLFAFKIKMIPMVLDKYPHVYI